MKATAQRKQSMIFVLTSTQNIMKRKQQINIDEKKKCVCDSVVVGVHIMLLRTMLLLIHNRVHTINISIALQQTSLKCE